MRRYTTVHFLASLAFVLALVSGASALERDTQRADERRAIAAVAAQAGVPEQALQASVRSALSTRQFRMLRVRGAGADVTVAIAMERDDVLLGGAPATLAQVTRAERASARLGELGAYRVAGWVAALGDGTCDMPSDARRAVSWRRLSGGGAELSYRFVRQAAHGRAEWHDCAIVLAPDGAPVDVRRSRHLPAAAGRQS